MRKVLLVTLFCLFPALATSATNTPVADKQDIIGCWERIKFSEAANKHLNEVEPWPLPYQWFCFEPDGTLYSLMTSNYSKHTSASLREAFIAIPKDVMYTLPQKGILITDQKSTQQKLVWAAYFTGKKTEFDGKVLEKGTLFMALFSEKKKKNVYVRYLKRVP
jgi:hypothetical protein